MKQRPARVEPLPSYMRRVVPFWRTLGLRAVRIGSGSAVFSCSFRPGYLQNGVAHGGVVASLLDSALACAALSRIYPHAYATTSQMHVTFLRPFVRGTLTARAKCLKAGRTLLFCEAKAYDARGRLVATAESELIRIPFPVPPR